MYENLQNNRYLWADFSMICKDRNIWLNQNQIFDLNEQKNVRNKYTLLN